MIEFEPDRTVWEQLRDEIRSRIKNGTYQPRMPIPSTTALCQEFGVARGTARKAVTTLIEEGWLRTVTGRGTFVSPREMWPDETDSGSPS